MTRDLQVTLRGGRVVAAYFHLRKELRGNVAKSKRYPDGMVVDYDAGGTPIGIEFLAPSHISLSKINGLLESLGQEAASVDELWPLINRATQAA